MLLNAYNSKAKVMIEHILQNYKQPCPSYVQREKRKNKLSYKKIGKNKEKSRHHYKNKHLANKKRNNSNK